MIELFISIGGNSTTKNLDCNGVIMSFTLFDVAKTDVFMHAVLVLLCFISDTIPIIIVVGVEQEYEYHKDYKVMTWSSQIDKIDKGISS